VVSAEDSRIATDELVAAVQDADFFRSLVENGSDAILSVDENSVILYANESVERVFGYEPEELIGERLTVIMPDRFHGQHFAAVEQYLNTGERTLDWNDIRLPAQHKQGHEIPLSITFEEHTYDGERVFSGIMRDVSDRVERERELERQNERLEKFASIVSHDLRDPLNTARATTSLVEAGDETAIEDLYAVYDEMETLIEDVLALARQGQAVGDLDAVGLDTAAEDAWATAGADTATLVLADDLPVVEADDTRLQTLLSNLFRNAVGHVGPAVTVSLGPLPEADEDGPFEGFYVEDDGDGFGDADTDELFEYGYTTDEAGTGLGLNIVAEVAEAHDWTVSATTGADGGARFEIRGVDPA
jgi:PAS domain S-box-containing protein